MTDRPRQPPSTRRLLRRIAMGAGGALAAVFGFGAALGCCAFAAPAYHGPLTDHFDGERFRNVPPTEQHGVRELLRWMRHREPGPWGPYRDLPPGPPPPTRVDGGAMRVTFVNHSTALLQMDGLNLLTDPVWSERVSPVSFAGPKRNHPPGIRFEDLPPIDVVLVSHNHYDHLDLPTLKRLRDVHQPRFVVPLGSQALLDRAGLTGSTELDWWQTTKLSPGVELAAVPAQHFSNRGATDQGRALWAGYVVRGPSGAAYFAGDTGFGPFFERIAERYAPLRLALLPIGAYRPRWFMKPVHMGPEEAVRAQGILRAETAVAVHFGTFRQADDGLDEPVQALQAALEATEPRPRFWALAPGEGREVPTLASTRAGLQGLPLAGGPPSP